MKAARWHRWISIGIGILALGLVVQPALAATGALPAGLPSLPAMGEAMQRDPVSGLALNGFDPVAYQAEGRPVAGLSAHELTYRGTVWRFATEANLSAFRDAPEIYLPAFSGFDAAAVAEGRAVGIDPRLFAVIGQRLHLFGSPANRSRFVADADLRARAVAGWQGVEAQISLY